MVTLVSVLIIVVCILLILAVLVQNPKGGGLSSSLTSSNQIMGVKKTADFLEKATWTLVVSLVALCLLHSMIDRPSTITIESEIQEKIDEEPIQQLPTLPQQPSNSIE